MAVGDTRRETEPIADADRYCASLGTVVANLQSLECLLRIYLLAIALKRGTASPAHDCWKLQIGDSVPENSLTNYDTLGRLIAKFNGDVGLRDPHLQLDGAVVDLRDLLAHGRVISSTPDFTEMRIVKFGRPKGRRATVTACALMNNDWFKRNAELVAEQLRRVVKAYEKYAV